VSASGERTERIGVKRFNSSIKELRPNINYCKIKLSPLSSVAIKPLLVLSLEGGHKSDRVERVIRSKAREGVR
jgi:hypothetical protein